MILPKMLLELTKCHLLDTNCSYLFSEQKGYDVIYYLKKWALQARHHVTRVPPHREVDTNVVSKPKKEGEQGDERRK